MTTTNLKVLLLIAAGVLFFETNIPAQPLNPTGWVPPPEPRVKPVIARHYPNDADGNRIEDSLEAKANAATPAQGTNWVEVRLVFTRQVTQTQIDAFEKLGGEISYLFRAVSYGWNGRIPLNQVKLLPQALGDGFILVQEPKRMRVSLLNATQQGRVRPVWATNYFSYPPGFSGSNDTTIGIVDTGVDDTHTDLTNRCLYWKDQSSDDFSTNKDVVGHGSHVAGIAFGTGAASGSAAGPLSFTLFGVYPPGTGTGDLYVEPLALVTNSTTWSATAKWDGGGATGVLLESSPAGKNNFSVLDEAADYSPAGFTNTFTPATTSIYMCAVESGVSIQLTNFVVTNHLSYYPAAGDGFNRLRGVAPGCNYAAEKVFTDTGDNEDTWIDAAIDDLAAQRTNLNVKVMNLSIEGTTADATLRGDINSAANDGIVMVISAGNFGPGTAISDPGAAAMAITVAAANSQIALTAYSSIGFTNPVSTSGQQEDYKPDLMAPGGSQYYGGILSVDSNDGDGTNFPDQIPNDYTIEMGTSMSSPFVAGAAALVIQAMEANGYDWDFNSSTDVCLVKMLLDATATESNTNRETNTNNPTLQRAAAGPEGYPVGKDPYEGYGMLNADAAIQAVQQRLYSGFTTNYSLGGSNTAARAWAGHFADSGSPFSVNLTVPATGDYDLYLYSSAPGTYGAPVILASSTQAGDGVSESIFYRPTTAGTNYLVVKCISGSGSFSLVVSNVANDYFTNATALSGNSGSLTGSNKGFSTETSEPLPTGGSASAWYTWTAPYTGIAVFGVSNGIPTAYTGASVSSLTKLSGQSAAATNVVAVTGGTTYHIQVCATNSAGTNFMLAWSFLGTSVSALNTNNISLTATINAVDSSPYPSPTTLSGLPGTILKATVTLDDYTMQGSTYCDTLLTSPESTNIALMVLNGNTSSFTNLTINFADGGAYPPTSSVLTNGTYQCSCPAAFYSVASPAPVRPYSTNLSDLIGDSPNGTWNLYAIPNTATTLNGSISNWSLNLTVDLPPTFSINTTTLNYTNGFSGSNVTISATLSSLYYPNLSGGSLIIEITNNAATGDNLVILNQGTGAGQVGVSGGVLSYGGTDVGTYTGGTGGSSPLVIAFTNTMATLAVAQQIITNIAFSSTSTSASTRIVEFSVTDSTGGSASASKSVAVTAANPAPVLASAIPNQAATYAGSFTYIVPVNTFTDADTGLTLTYTATGAILGTNSGVTFTNSTRTFSATNIDSGAGGTIAGGNTVQVIATDNGTPSLSATDSFTLTINKAVSSVTPSAATRAYGATNPVFAGTLSGFVAADSISANYVTAATTNSAPGSYSITATLNDPHNDAGNYTITTNAGTLTIAKGPATVTANAQARAYGSTNPVFTVTYTGLTNGQTLATSGITGAPTLTTAAATNSPPGTYVITNSIGSLASADYSFTLSNSTLTVTQAVLSVTASNLSRVYGATNPVFTGLLAGVTNGDNITATFTCSAITNSAPGTYSIVAGLNDPGDKLGNYRVTTNNGTLTVSKAVLLATANSGSRAYGTTNPVFAVSYSGFANGETASSGTISGSPVLTTSAATNSMVGAYAITNSVGSLASADYSLTLSNGTLTVTQAVLTVTPASAARAYDLANPTFTGTISGLANNDNITANYSTAASVSSPVGLYSITATLSDPSSRLPNYNVTTNQGTLTVTNRSGNGSASVGVTASDSVVSLATNETKDYTFTDTNSGLMVVVAVTMTPYSSVTNDPAFTLLDFYGANDTPVHLGINSGLGSGDGNWVDYFEGVNFTASLVSASSDVITNSIQFGIANMGIRPSGASLVWTSPMTTNSFSPSAEALYPLDTNTMSLAGTVYSGQLRTSNLGGQYQLSDYGTYADQSIVMSVTFDEGNGAPEVTANPAAAAVCAGDIAGFVAAAVGDPDPAVQWQVETNGGASFVNLPGATNATLTLTAVAADNGNQYQAVFTNLSGSMATAAAALTVDSLPSATISLSSTNLAENSAGNTAAAPAGAAAYAWTITNGVITSATNLPTITFTAGTFGSMCLNLTVANADGCAVDNSTNVSISSTNAPSFSSFTLTNNQFQFTVTGAVGESYILEAATNLALPDWFPIATNPAPFLFIESNADLYSQRFYRVITAP